MSTNVSDHSMIFAGNVSEIAWSKDSWVFLDIGFANESKSCGLLVGEEEPKSVQFGDARQRIVQLAKSAKHPLNLVIEAPLSVCFTAAGNPTGRSLEKIGSKTRYWYAGLGCAVMIAATYLIRDLHTARLGRRIRLFEGFVSFKDRTLASDHRHDVKSLREVVLKPESFHDRIIGPDKLRRNPTDLISSAFSVAGMDCGVPPVICGKA